VSRRFLGGLLTATLALSALMLPRPTGAQWLRLEDPIRQQERWERDFNREQREQARDRERDEAIIRDLRDQAWDQRMRDADREMREQIREDQRQREREQDRRERQEQRDAHCVQGYHDRGDGVCR
jgi:hypothetical protein